MPDTNVEVWRVAVAHGVDLTPADVRALTTVRRALVGLLHHGFISDLETHSRAGITEWSWAPGDLEGEGVRLGLLDVLAAIAPDGWEVK